MSRAERRQADDREIAMAHERRTKDHAAELARAYRSFPVRTFTTHREPTPYVKQEQCTLVAEASDLEAYLGERGLAWFDRGQRIVVHGDSADTVWECTSIVRSDEGELQLAVYYPTLTSLAILNAIRPGVHWRLEIFND